MFVSLPGFISCSKPESMTEVVTLRESIVNLQEAIKTGITNFNGMRDAIIGLKEIKISQETNRACNRQIRALNGFISTNEKVEAFCAKILLIIDEKLKEENQ